MKTILSTSMKVLPLFFATAILAQTCLAEGSFKLWRASNHSGQTVKVFFRATGCEGITTSCNGGNIDYVCEAKVLQAEQETEYQFVDGTSAHSKSACLLDEKTGLVESSDPKRNGLIVETKTKFGHFIYNYNQLEWYYE